LKPVENSETKNKEEEELPQQWRESISIQRNEVRNNFGES